MVPTIPLALHFGGDPLVALAVNLVVALALWKLRWVTRGGVVAALLVGLPSYAAFGPVGYGMVAATLVLMDLAARHGTAVLAKKKKGISERKFAAKGFVAMFLPGVVALLAGVSTIVSHEPEAWFLSLLAFATSLAASLGDAVSTEFGQAYGKRTYQIITLERVRSGTRGGVSVEGSVAGAVAIVVFVVAIVPLLRWFGPITHMYEPGVKEAVVIIFAALLANHIQSVIGGILAQFQRKPSKLLLSFLGTGIAAILALFFTSLPNG